MIQNNKKVSVIGLGVSGLAVAEALTRRGYEVFVSEEKVRSKIDPKILKKFDALKVGSEFGAHTNRIFENTSMIIVSPGVDLSRDIIKKAKRTGVRIISEVELAYSFIKKPMIAITGTNGKTTTVALTADILKAGRRSTIAAGNIGYPLINVDDSKLDYVVAEISSYQLEATDKFRPYISAILNLTEDHLLRHKSMQRYSASKARIFRNQRSSDHLVYNFDDPLVRRLCMKAKCRKVPFSVKQKPKNGIYVDGDAIVSSISGKRVEICGISDIFIKGMHNVQNSLAAAAIAIICGVPKEAIKRTLKAFRGVEHRIEYVRSIKGVSFYNDSKGTNPDSTVVAINAIYPKNKIILILGGRDKKTSLLQLRELVKRKVKKVVLLGEAAQRFRQNLNEVGYKDYVMADSFLSAVKSSFRSARRGDAVLLSPACASFDMFRNYEERGRVFKKIVDDLAGKSK